MRRARAGIGSSSFPSPPKGRCTCVSQSSFTARASSRSPACCSPLRRRAPRSPCSPSSSAAWRRGSRPTRGPRASDVGPDGNVWMAEWRGPGRIAKVTPAGAVTEFTGRRDAELPRQPRADGHRAGPDGNLWVTEFTNAGGVVKITPGGPVTEYPLDGEPQPDGDHRGPGRQPVVHRAGQPGADHEDHDRRRGQHRGHRRHAGFTANGSRAGSRSGRTATSGSPSSRARGGSGGSRRRAS